LAIIQVCRGSTFADEMKVRLQLFDILLTLGGSLIAH
jgi:hypothetical protein